MTVDVWRLVSKIDRRGHLAGETKRVRRRIIELSVWLPRDQDFAIRQQGGCGKYKTYFCFFSIHRGIVVGISSCGGEDASDRIIEFRIGRPYIRPLVDVPTGDEDLAVV